MAGPYTRVGFSYDHQSDITATATAFPCTVDATNAVEAANFPRNCNVQSIEFSIDTIASSAASIHMYLVPQPRQMAASSSWSMPM